MTDDDFTLSPIKRPEALEKVIVATQQFANKEKETYINFLRMVMEAQREYFRISNTCSIKFSHKFSQHIVRKNAENSSFRMSFFFYTRLRLRGQQMGSKQTFSGIDFANENMNLQQLVCFLRDFQAIPTLVSKEDIQFLWKVQSLQRVRLGQKPLQYLSFDETKDFLSRVALVSYNRPGMRRLILNTQGSMPSNYELIQTFCRFFHFDDVAWVTNRINTVGAERVSSQTMLLKGETSDHTKKELLDDRRAKRIVKAHKKHSEEENGNSPSNSPVKKASRRNRFGGDEIIDPFETEVAVKIAKAIQQKTNGLGVESTQLSAEKKMVPSSSVDDDDANLDTDLDIDPGSDFRGAETGSALSLTPMAACGGYSLSKTQEEALLGYDPIDSRVFEQYSLEENSKV